MNKAVDDIKVKNPNIVIVDYCILGQVHSTSTGQKPLRDKLEAEKWYLYQSGAGGSKVLDGASLTPRPQGRQRKTLEHLVRRLSLRPGLETYQQARRDLHRQLLLEAGSERRLESRWEQRQPER
jgi:hypothetical protein